MIDAGLEQEVKGLLERGYRPELKSMLSIGYRHMVNYLRGIWDKEEMERILARDTRHYAKRQLTWFHNAAEINWFDIKKSPEIFIFITDWLKQQN